MPYTPNSTWQNTSTGGTPLSAARLQNMEDGIEDADTRLTAAESAITGKQPLDGDLTAIAALSPSNDDVVQRKAGAWTNRTMAQLATDLSATSTWQPLDGDLTTIAGLTATTDNMIQSVGSAWASRTPAQVKTALALNNVSNSAQIPVSIVDAKGDLIAGTAADTAARVAVGTNGYMLQADSAQTAGVGWTAQPVPAPTTLTDGATVALNASLGKVHKLTAAGNRTILTPTGSPADGQALIIAHTASGGSRTLALTTGSSGAFAFGTDITALTATTSGTTDYIGCIYDSTSARFRVVSYAKGY
jgi:hypothetical protein